MTANMHTSGFTSELQLNIGSIRTLLGGSADLVVREMIVARERRAALLYLDGMTDVQSIQEFVISPLMERIESEELSLNLLAGQVIQAGEFHYATSLEEGVDQILSGCVLVMLDGEGAGLLLSMAKWDDRGVDESKTQPVVRGPQHAFTEKIRTNTTLVRRRVKDMRLRLTNFRVGKLTKTDVSIMYLEGIADPQLVQQLSGSINNIQKNELLEGEFLEEILLENKQFSIFPRFYNSDRPDTIAAGIMEGRVAIFIDGTPFVLLAPTLFVDFIDAAEDYYQPFVYSSAIRILRYLALFISLFVPSIYVALTTFHQDMIPTQLLLSIAGQREGVPFPAFVEAMLMEVTFEILREAGIRMPRTIGQAVSIVGTLVIGQAAVEAGIVSAAMVIVVAVTAISSFTIPAYNMSVPIRLSRFVFICIAASFGIYGVSILIFLLVIHLCNLQSFGTPYFSPLAPYRKRMMKDALLRFPYRDSNNS